MDDRVVIFIDGSNLYHALRENVGRTDLNFAEFSRKLVGDRTFIRTYYYNVLQDPVRNPDGNREQSEFLNVLRGTPFLEVRLGGTKLSQGATVEKGVDVMLATDIVYFSWIGTYDTALLVSGDSDFAYALQTIKNMGKRVEVAYFETNASRDLLETADTTHLLTKVFFQGLWGGKPRPAQPRRHTRPRTRPHPASPPPERSDR